MSCAALLVAKADWLQAVLFCGVAAWGFAATLKSLGATWQQGMNKADAGAGLLATAAAQVDPTAALRAVDIGPPADQEVPARAFREFWGDRSELRRFQDGSICEAVVWECGPAERHLIPDRCAAVGGLGREHASHNLAHNAAQWGRAWEHIYPTVGGRCREWL
jgi:hypothetical protein